MWLGCERQEIHSEFWWEILTEDGEGDVRIRYWLKIVFNGGL
jgi:hypothetical protein